MPVSRFGVSLEEEILKELDEYVVKNSYPNRSQAIRAIVEKYIVEKKWQCNNVVAGAIVMVYDHHKGDITTKANDIQHDYYDVILSAQHFHLSHNVCLEIIAVKGTSSRLTELSDKILGIKGVTHGKLVMSKAE
jgi:CopG family nickel-responsive transcriptional regulator